MMLSRYLILISIKFYDFISLFSPLVLVLIQKIQQTRKTMFHHIPDIKVCQKYSAVHLIFNSLLSVWKRGETQSFMVDVLHEG